jgi:two-component system sensor histidine kinase BaeS
VANSLRHTGPGGSVALTASRAGDRVAVEVADTGSGIAPEHLPHVGERFYRGDRARSSDGGGVGLGLAIVRSIVDLHGGELSLSSEVGRGTRVCLLFPARASSPRPPAHDEIVISP